MVKKIAIIGMGTVGEATIRSLKKNAALISRRKDLDVEIKGVCDVRKEKETVAKSLGVAFTTDAYQLINDPEVDVIVELIGGIEPAKSLILAALKNKKHVVTANKALLAQHGAEIFNVALENNVAVGFEASVCGAIPLIEGVSRGLVSSEIKKIEGILNGTTNYILHRMTEERMDFALALKEAQKKGFAEKNPHFDVEGIDTLHKLCILAYLCFGVWPKLDKVYTEGITKITLMDILYAEELGYRIKLLAIAKKEDHDLDLRVHPALVCFDHPLAEVDDAYNAAFLDTVPAGQLLFYGLGAGGAPTSASVISDVVNILLGGNEFFRGEEKVKLKNIKEVTTRYYLRFMAKDRPGVLAAIAKVLASCKISIASVQQREVSKGKLAPVVILTHRAKEADLQKALARIDKLDIVKHPTQVIRIEDL